MKKKLKIFVGIILVTILVLIYTTAVTQTSGLPKQADKKITNVENNDADTTDIGEPTGDDPWKEMNNLLKAYYVKNGVLYQGTMKLFDGNGDDEKLLEEKKFQYTYFDNEYSYSLAPLEVINKKNYAVIINHDDKVIAVTPKISARKKNKDLFSLADFRKIIEDQKANIKVTLLGNEKILTIDNIQDPEIQGYRIYYSPETYKISKMLIGMIRLSPLDDESITKQENTDESNNSESKTGDEIDGYTYYLEINYSVIKPLSLFPGMFNPENEFVKIEGKKIELTSKYKEYQLFNSDGN
jgi:hypothetical protein